MRNLGGALGIGACATILISRTNLHFMRLAEHLNATNAAAMEFLHRSGSAGASVFSGDTAHGQTAALKRLFSLTMREAQTLTFSDAFVCLTVCLVLATLMVPLMRRGAKMGAPVADAH